MSKIQLASRYFTRIMTIAARLPPAYGLLMDSACVLAIQIGDNVWSQNWLPQADLSTWMWNPAHFVTVSDSSALLKILIMILWSYFSVEVSQWFCSDQLCTSKRSKSPILFLLKTEKSLIRSLFLQILLAKVQLDTSIVYKKKKNPFPT